MKFKIINIWLNVILPVVSRSKAVRSANEELVIDLSREKPAKQNEKLDKVEKSDLKQT